MTGMRVLRWTSVLLVVLLVTATRPSAGGPADPPPSPQVVEVESGRQGGFRVPGEVQSATSSDPDLVKIDGPNPANVSFLNFTCTGGKKGAAAVTVTWKDQSGREQRTLFVVACAVNIAQNLSVNGEVFRWQEVGTNLPRFPGGSSVETKDLFGDISNAYVPADSAGETTPGLVVTPQRAGLNIALITITPRGGEPQYWLVTFNATARTSQVQIPEQRLGQVVLQAAQCPSGMVLDTRTTRLATPEQYAGQGFERQAASLRSLGVTSLAESNCIRPGGPRGRWRMGSFAARVNTSPITHESMAPPFRAVQDLFQMKTRDFRIFPVLGSAFGDQQEAWAANYTLSSGDRNLLLGYTARHGNVLYGVMAQGEMSSVPQRVPESDVLPFMQQVKSNLDAATR